jgi:predicted ATPase
VTATTISDNRCSFERSEGFSGFWNLERTQSTFFGRKRERQQLWDAYQRVLDRCGGGVGYRIVNPSSHTKTPGRSNHHHHDPWNSNANTNQSDAAMILSPPPSPLVAFESNDRDITAAVAAEYMNSLVVQKEKNIPLFPPDSSSLSQQRSNTLETVFLHGRSGVGKTFFLEDFRRRVQQQQEKQNCIVGILHAKHVMPSSSSSHLGGTASCGNDIMAMDSVACLPSGEGNVAEPFGAFKDIFEQLIAFLIQLLDGSNHHIEPKTIRLFSEKFNEIVLDGISSSSSTTSCFQGRLVRDLVRDFPDLKRLLVIVQQYSLDSNCNDVKISSETDKGLTEDELKPFSAVVAPADQDANSIEDDRTLAQNQLGLVLIRILRVIARSITTVPIILILEDLQWADVESLDLISTLVGEIHLDNILMIASFRDDHNHDDDLSSRQLVTCPARLSVYSIVFRKHYQQRGGGMHLSSDGDVLPVLRPTKLSTTQSFSAIPKVLGSKNRKGKQLLRDATMRIESNGPRRDFNDDLLPPTSSINRAVTLGSYASFTTESVIPLSNRRSTNDAAPTWTSGARFAPSSPIRHSMPERTLSLIEDDEAEAEDVVLPTHGVVPMVPPRASFGKAPSYPSKPAPPQTSILPRSSPSIPGHSKFQLSSFRTGSKRNLSTTSDTSLENSWNVEPRTGTFRGFHKKTHKERFREAMSSRHDLESRQDLFGDHVVPSFGGSGGSAAMCSEDSLRSCLAPFPPPELQPKRTQSFAANMFGKLSIGRTAKSNVTVRGKAVDKRASGSVTANWDRPPNPERLLQRFNIVDVLLGTWDTYVICECLSCLLDLEAAECHSLAVVVEKKTHGNPDSVIKFTDFLRRDGLLGFSIKTYRWEWDSDHIDVITMATSDVGELLAARIKFLPSDSLSVLKVAACIGMSFDETMLDQLVELPATEAVRTVGGGAVKPMANETTMAMKRILDQCCDAGLLETEDDSSYRFSHDLVQQNLYSRIEEGKLCSLHYRIGKAIQASQKRKSNSTQDTQRKLYDCANHFFLGKSAISTKAEKIEIFKLHLRASAAARNQGSFRAAAIFLERAIASFLSHEDWSNNYVLVLEAYSSAAEVLFSCGDLGKSMEYAEQVIQHASSVEERLRGNFVKIDVLVSQRRFTAAINHSFMLLDVLGCHIPTNFKWIRVYADLLKIRSAISGKSLPELLAMKRMRSVLQLSALRIMDTIVLLLALRGDDDLGNLLLTRMVLTTIASGISVYAPYSLAGYGMLLCYTGDVQSGYHYGELSLRMAESFQSKRALVRTAYIVYTYLFWTRKPLTEGIEVMLNAHRMGMRVGDLEYSSMCL